MTNNILAHLLLIGFSFVVFSCSSDDNGTTNYQSNNITQIPQGGTGTLSNTDLTNSGVQTNIANTTVNIDGDVVVDDFAVHGTLVVPEDDNLTVNGDLVIGGGANMEISGTVTTENLTIIGDLFTTNAQVTVTNKLTIGGGITLYTNNSLFNVKELVIIGHILSDSTEEHSVFNLTDVKSFHRADGTNVCGPIAYNSNQNLGASPISLVALDTTTRNFINEKYFINNNSYYYFKNSLTCK